MEDNSLFDFLILSLGNAALIGLGLVTEPGTTNYRKNLELAKHNVDLLEILQEKTRGNLTQREEEMIKSLLADLKLKYVEAQRKA